jgi:signal transduction histidine kinase
LGPSLESITVSAMSVGRRSPKPRSPRGSPAPRAAAAARLLAVAEEEIQRIVLDLHDGPVQDIFAALSQLTSLRARISASEQPTEAAALARAITALESSPREVRGLLSTLRGPAFAERELRELLAEAAVEHEALTGAAIGLDLRAVPAVPLAVKIGLYRILQEALSNVRRHAEAATASVRLRARKGCILLEISDQGRGFEPPALSGPGATRRPEHIGLRGMKERAVLMHGSLSIVSRPGHGTRVRAEIPVDA